MTEQEAKTRWCPFARTFDWCAESASMDVPAQMMFVAGNRQLTTNEHTRCLGSACMAWRKGPNDYLGVPPVVVETGFCGLAGKP